jgi:hypothetical protein
MVAFLSMLVVLSPFNDFGGSPTIYRRQRLRVPATHGCFEPRLIMFVYDEFLDQQHYWPLCMGICWRRRPMGTRKDSSRICLAKSCSRWRRNGAVGPTSWSYREELPLLPGACVLAYLNNYRITSYLTHSC